MARQKDKALAAWLATDNNPWDYRGPLSDDAIAALTPPTTGTRLKYDTTVKGFAARVTANGARSFVLNYRSVGRERRITIGSFPSSSHRRAEMYATTSRFITRVLLHTQGSPLWWSTASDREESQARYMTKAS